MRRSRRAAVALGTSTTALQTLGREVLAGTAAVGGLSGVAQGAARGDALGIAAGVLQTAAAVAGGLAAGDRLPEAAKEFARAVAWGAGAASAGASAADAFAHGDLAGGLLASVGLLLSQVREAVLEDERPSGNQAAPREAVPQDNPPAPGAGGSGAGSGASWPPNCRPRWWNAGTRADPPRAG